MSESNSQDGEQVAESVGDDARTEAMDPAEVTAQPAHGHTALAYSEISEVAASHDRRTLDANLGTMGRPWWQNPVVWLSGLAILAIVALSVALVILGSRSPGVHTNIIKERKTTVTQVQQPPTTVTLYPQQPAVAAPTVDPGSSEYTPTYTSPTTAPASAQPSTPATTSEAPGSVEENVPPTSTPAPLIPGLDNLLPRQEAPATSSAR